jgi:hypothetical protein
MLVNLIALRERQKLEGIMVLWYAEGPQAELIMVLPKLGSDCVCLISGP